MANQPKNYKKFVATAATATLVASAIVPVASAASFSDIEGNDHADAIKALSDAGIIKGYEDGTFKPNAEISRGQTVKLLGRWLETKGYKVPGNWNTVQRFNDLPVNAADQELVKYAALVKDAGVFNGSNGNLNYNQPMQRQQMALVLVRAIKTVEGIDLIKEYKDAGYTSKIKDLDKAYSTENVEAITALEYAGITVVENFNPTSAITRGQFSSFLYRTINYEAPVKEPKVESVRAINASQILVKFNKDVDSSVTAANFELKKADGTLISITNVKLLDDNRTVLLTVSPITSKTTFTATVKNVKLAGSLTGEVFPLFSTVLTVEDKVNPEIVSVESKTNTDVASSVTINFSEPVTAGAIKIDGTTKAYILSPDGMSATVSGLSLDANKTHTVEIVNLTDTAGNISTLVSKTFNVTKDVTAPTFTVSTESDNKIVLTFDKAVDINTINTTNIVLKDEKLDTVAGYGVSVPTGFGNKRVEITLPARTYESKDTRSFTILASDAVKDYLGNKLVATSKTVTITKDTTAPNLTGIDYVKDSTGKVTSVLFKFDEKVVKSTIAGLTATDITTGASVDLFGTLAASDVNVLSDGKTVKVDVKGTATVKSGKLEIYVPANFVTDTALTPNNSAAKKLVVDFGAGTTAELKVHSVTNPARNQYKVTFTDVVTYASATNPANYTINGVALPANTTIVFDTTNKNNVTITLPSGFITADDTGAVLRVQNVETVTGTKVSANTNVITVDDNAGPVIVKEKSQINANGTLSIGFSESVIAASASALSDLVFTINGSTVTVGNGNVTVVDGTGSDAGKYVVTFHTDVTSTADTNGKYYEYFDINGNNTLDATDIIVTTSTSALTPGVFNLNSVSSLKVGTVASPSVITDTNTYSGAPAANTIVEKQSVVIK